MKAILSLLSAAFLLCASAPAQPALTDAAPPKFTAKTVAEFRFDGGSLPHFLNAIRDAFGVDLRKIGTVPESMFLTVRVPKMRRAASGQGSIGFRGVLDLYNQISTEGDPSLGRWLVKGGMDQEPDVVMLVPPKPSGDDAIMVKAFSMSGRNKEESERLLRLVRDTLRSQRYQMQDESSPADLNGSVRYHREAGILVVTGGRLYVEMATAIIDAVREKREKADVPVPAETADKPE